jgi:small glutamine-rich tetratricopeptide repeat-containing protein alpha
VAFEKGLELDPSNKVMQQSLMTSKQKAVNHGVAESSNTGASARSTGTSSSGGAGGMPDLSSLLGGAGGAGGGMPELSSILNNPAMMNMATQMMQNPEMMRM